MLAAACAVESCDRPREKRDWCQGHYLRWKRHGDLRPDVPLRQWGGDPSDRFWSKVDRSGSCWLWMATVNGSGYGMFKANGRMVLAHRFSYEEANGPIHEGRHLDHLCRVRNCVNPGHLEAVEPIENHRRAVWPNTQKAACPAGHPYDDENTYVDRLGKRSCRACHRQRQSRYNARRSRC